MKQTALGRASAAILTATMALTLSLASHAEDDELPIAPDEFVYCTVCHGVQLMGNRNIDAPRLSGMAPWYVEQQLNSFKNGWRGAHAEDLVGMEMRPMAAALTDQEIAAVAQFVQATQSPHPAVSIEGDVESGRQLYAPCIACHGANAEGNEALGAPALTGIDDWYLVRQLENYQTGIRGSHPGDVYGMQMRASVSLLRDKQAIDDVVRYITTLK